MRLTLRTLLAYLDDMLDPSETKAIGQKVAESDAAQELIARIKQVTRRRRLTTPPATGPNAFEPNTVADYLDNTLPAEQIAEVEKACLESDVHLAEIAAAHQILTLVVSQPALVPPTARQRMYALIHGRKPARARPAAAATATAGNGAAEAADGHADEDETLLLGLPLYRRHAAMRWLLPLAAVLLVVVLAIAIWQALPPGVNNSVAAVTGSSRTEPPAPIEETKKEDSHQEAVKPDPVKPDPVKPDPVKPEVTPTRPVRAEPPSKERREVGRYVPPTGAAYYPVLVSRTTPAAGWQRLTAKDNKVSSNDAVVSLPGYHSEVRLDSGVGVTLLGSTYELVSVVLESAVTLHAPPEGFDADLTLDRGAVTLTNRKDKKAEVRVRFRGEVWDVTLEEPATEVGLWLWSRHLLPYGSGEPPHTDVALFVFKKRASVRVSPFSEYDNLEPGAVPMVMEWDNDGPGAQAPYPAKRDARTQAQLAAFSKPQLADARPEVKQLIGETEVALEELSKKLSGPTRVETGLVETLQVGDAAKLNGRMNGILAIRGLGALDAVGDLVNILGDEKSPAFREEAITTLRHWIGRNEGQEARLVDQKTWSGVLTSGNKYSRGEALKFMELLHPPSREQIEAPAFWAELIEELRSDKLAIRELAFFHLRRWVREWQKVPYRTDDTGDKLKAGYDAWKKLIPDGKLPPGLQR